MRHDTAKKVIKYVVAFVIIALIYYYRHKIINILTPFILGAIMAYIIYPMSYYFEKKGMMRSRSIIITFIIIIILLFLVFRLLTPYIVEEVNAFTDELPEIKVNVERGLNILKENLNSVPGAGQAITDIYARINGIFMNSFKELPERVGTIFSSFLNFILSPIIAFYILLDREKLYANLYLLIPENGRKMVEPIVSDVDRIINGYIRGQFYINLFVAIFTSVGLLVIHVKLAVLLGIFTGILNFIPYFGPIIAAIPTVIMALLDSPQKALYALIIYLVVQQLESGILAPRILSENVGLHPLVVMFLIILGQEFFGIWGMLLSVPLAAVLRVIFIRIAQI